MSNYTPGYLEVRDAYANTVSDNWEGEQEFDRWLESNDHKVIEAAAINIGAVFEELNRIQLKFMAAIKEVVTQKPSVEEVQGISHDR